MFKSTVIKLLEGGFVCRVSFPDMFTFLQDEENRRKMGEYLGLIGRKLASSANGEAYFAAFVEVGAGERTEIRSMFKEIKYDLRPVLGFLNLVMQAQHSDRTLATGDVIDFSKMLLSITESPHLTESLRKFPAMGKEFAAADAHLKTILDRVLKRMVSSGYLIPSKDGDKYEVTGKIDFYYEVIDFLSENEVDLAQAQDMGQEGQTEQMFQ